MKKYSSFLVLSVLLTFVLVIPGCGGGGGGGGSKASSNDDIITNAQGVIESFYRLTDLAVKTQPASLVTTVFHVENNLGEYHTSLTLDDFKVIEDGEPLFPTESSISITPSQVPFKSYTVLMIDNSSSSTNLGSIKVAAKSLIPTVFLIAPDGSAEQLDHTGFEYFQIYSFSETCNKLLPDFSNNVAEIEAAIESIEPGDATTDLYGSVIEGVSQWTDGFTTELVEKGVLVLFTDGIDTQSSSALETALTTRGDRKIITAGVGIGRDDDTSRENLAQLGNAGFYYFTAETEDDGTDDEVPEFDSVEEILDEDKLVAEVADSDSLWAVINAKHFENYVKTSTFASTFYRVNYISPKRGEGEHTLTFTINENINTDIEDQAEIKSDYECDDFFSPREGIYVNGVSPMADEDYYINIAKGTTTEIRFNEYLNKSLPDGLPAPPNYTINSSDTTKVTMTSDPDDSSVLIFTDVGSNLTVMTMTQDPYDQSVYTVSATNNGPCGLTITDSNNQIIDEADPDAGGVNFSRSFNIYISDHGTPGRGLIAHYAFNGDTTDSSGNGNDATGSGVEFDTDRFGDDDKAMLINDKNDFVTLPGFSDDTFSKNTMTVSLWYEFRLTNYAPNTLLGSNSDGYDYLAIQDDFGLIGIYNDDWFLSDFRFILGRLYHIVLVKDGNNSKIYLHDPIKTYPDGPSLVYELNENFENGFPPLSVIGNRGGSNQDQGSMGVIDDVRIYDCVLSESEIMNLFLEH